MLGGSYIRWQDWTISSGRIEYNRHAWEIGHSPGMKSPADALWFLGAVFGMNKLVPFQTVSGGVRRISPQACIFHARRDFGQMRVWRKALRTGRSSGQPAGRPALQFWAGCDKCGHEETGKKMERPDGRRFAFVVSHPSSPPRRTRWMGHGAFMGRGENGTWLYFM